MPSRPATLPHHANAAFIPQLLQKILNLRNGKRGKHLLKVVQRAAFRIVVANMREKQFFLGLMVKASLASVNTLLTQRRIEPTREKIANTTTASHDFDNARFNQNGKSLLLDSTERPIAMQCIERQKIMR